MFTGIIEELGRVSAIEPIPGADAARLRIAAGAVLDGLPAGGSLAVNGVCLTAVPDTGDGFAADVMGETLARTSLGALSPGDPVNLERCMPAGCRFDGHVVQGHVDATGTIAAVEDLGGWTRVRIATPAELAPLIAEKGSIAVDGTSLTITAVSEPGAERAWFEVGLIPATLERTVLGLAAPGRRVNLEADVFAKYAARLAAFAPAPTPAQQIGAPA